MTAQVINTINQSINANMATGYLFNLSLVLITKSIKPVFILTLEKNSPTIKKLNHKP
jgi:hypothetical protein